MAVAVMIKPKKKQLVVGEMDLDKAVASPAQMEAEAKENERNIEQQQWKLYLLQKENNARTNS